MRRWLAGREVVWSARGTAGRMRHTAVALVTTVTIMATVPLPARAAPLRDATPPDATAAAVGAGDWAQFGGGPAHTGYNAAESRISAGNISSLTLAWRLYGGDRLWAPPAIANGVVYLTTLGGQLWAIPEGCGKGGLYCEPIWSATLGGASATTPAVADGVVYVGSDDHKVYAFAVGCASGGGTCTPIWTATLGSYVESSPTVSGGVVYVGSHDGNVYAFAVGCASGGGTCTPLWHGQTGNYVEGSPAVDSGKVYVTSDDRHVYAFAVGCGAGNAICNPVWTSQAAGNRFMGSPVVSDGVVYAGSQDGNLYAYPAMCSTTCAPLWIGPAAQINGTPAVAGGVVYVGARDNKVYAFATGCSSGGGSCTPMWTGTVGDKINNGVAVANGVVYASSIDKKLYAFGVGCSTGGGSCSPLWVAAIPGMIQGNAPSIANGYLYVGSNSGDLSVFSLGSDDWTHFHNVAARTGANAIENTLAWNNVNAIQTMWSAAISGISDSSPVVAGGVVYVATQTGHVYAFPAGCSSGDFGCSAIWTATVGGVYGGLAVSATEVFVASMDHNLYAFHVGCGSSGATCTPDWVGQTGGAISTSSPAVSAGVVYVGSEDGKLYAFPVGCNTGGGACTPLWTGAVTAGKGISSSPAVSGGMVYVGAEDNKVHAFAVGCNTGGGACSPTWTGTTGGWVRSSPAVSGGVVYVGSDDHKLYAFPASCSGACSPTWTGETGGTIGSSPAVAEGSVYVGSSDNFVNAIGVGCNTGGGSCDFNWKGGATGVPYRMDSSPAVADWVVFIGSTDGHFRAFGAGCGGGGATCQPLLDLALSSAFGLSSPAVVQASVYIADQGGHLLRLALPYNPATYHAITPARVLDTRPSGTGVTNIGLTGQFVKDAVRSFGVAGVPYVGGGSAVAIPASAVAVTGNLTVTRQNAAGSLGLSPSTYMVADLTTLEFQATGNRADNVTIGLARDGTLDCDLSSGTAGARADVVFDITGYFTTDYTGSTYQTLSPGRVLDTRPTGSGHTHIGLSGKFANKAVRTVAVGGIKGLGWSSAQVPSNASAITGNVTVTNATSAGYVSFGPTMTSSPKTSTLNTDKGKNTANGVTVALKSGKVQAVWVGTTGSSADVLLDVTGYFQNGAGGLRYYALSPSRPLDTRFSIGLSGQFTSPNVRTLALSDVGGVPRSASAISGTLTVLNAGQNGYAFAAPTISGTPSSSTVNTNTGVAASNGLDVALGTGANLSLVWMGGVSTADLALDVTGWWGP